ncbi:MAG TPA: isoprenylcysteine carboxylmethyltransferase family protein [Tepidisphaeraceae bacterium]|jgi:protein-S-isoprenylcysteine O-methyltransferase Ste14
MTIDRETPRRRGALRQALLSSVVFLVLLMMMLFLPAGIRWRNGWIFLGVFLALSLVASIYLWRANPDIFVARGQIHRGTKSWDKPLLALILTSFFAMFLVAAFDARFGWSSVPRWLIIAGYTLLTVGFALSTWVYAVNRFAEPSVRIQSDRGQRVIDKGPYAIVRHPLYAFSTFLVFGIALALGSYWALIPVAVGMAVLIFRTTLEDRMLHKELEGYSDYAARVRWRLIPGIW